MEPCAPGTEDDPPIMYSTLNKKENEQERLLSQKAYLRSGKYQNIFELSYQNGTEHWYCNACECPVMGRVFQHEAGRRHMSNITKTQNPMDEFRKGSSPDEPSTVEVAPGEPLPPGFEEVSRVSQIQERLDGFKAGPLVALEYLLELQDDDSSKEPFYLCILCDKKGDPRTVLTHLASYNHISQYLQKHFPTCWRTLAPYNTKQYRRNWQTALQKIAEGIEKKFGRLKPYPIEKDKFEKDRMHYLQMIGKGRHFSDKTGYTFEELVVPDELTKTHEDDKSYESSTANNWGNSATIEKPFKKRSPSPPKVGIPSKRNKGNALTNPRKPQNQEPAYVVAKQLQQQQQNQLNNLQAHSVRLPPQQLPQGPPQRLMPNEPPERQLLSRQPPERQPFSRQPSERQALSKLPPGRPELRRRSLSSVSSDSDGSSDSRKRFGKDNDGEILQRGRPPFDRERQLPYGRRRSPSPKRRSPFRRRSPSPRRRVSPSHNSPIVRRRSPSPIIKRRSQSPTAGIEQEKEKLRKIEEFRKLARAIENDMHKTLKQHEKNPEKHPQYNEEWKKFWNKRYKELKTQGVDVQKHDFKPEWIEFWNKRMIEIHSDELRNRKEALRKRLALPEEMNPIKFKIGTNPLVLPDKISAKPLPMAAMPDQDNEVIVIEDKDDDKVVNKSSSWEDSARNRGGPVRKPPNKRSLSPSGKREKEKSYIKQRSRSRDRIRNRSRSWSREKPYKRSLSREKTRAKIVSPIENKNSRPVNRSTSRERFSGRRSRSASRSGRNVSAKRSLSRDRTVASRTKNLSPISVNSNVSRNNKGRAFRNSRDRSLSRTRSHSRNRSHSRSRATSPYGKRPKDRRSNSRERSWERRDFDRKRGSDFVRESSFERDIRAKERVRTVADLPWERERDPTYRNPYLPPPIMRDVTRKPSFVNTPEDEDDEMEVNVVDVLRLLTALEERLGSLGPKIIDLLAQALALEKNEANSSESLLDNDINCVLFETVKEKLKGQLFAGLVDMLQERAFKKSIKKIASLLHMAGQRKRQREKLLPRVTPVTVPGVGKVDKAAIAKQIANALVAQGKTDVTQAELETLINAVVGMAEVSKNSNKPMTTSNFLQLLGADKAEREPDKIIIPTSAKKPELTELEKLTEPLTPSPGKNSASNMENLSDSDLQTLLQNFKDLSTEEQHNLINYLKKLEYQEPERVERLRKFVNLEPSGKVKDEFKEDKDVEDAEKTEKRTGRDSPFSSRMGGGTNPTSSLVNIESDEENDKEEENDKQQVQKKVHVDSEEDEYSFEDVVKSVSKNVKDKEMEHSKKVLEDTMKYDKSKSELDLNNAKDLISGLMGNITKSNSNSTSIDLLGLGTKPLGSTPQTNMANVDLTKLCDINMANLTNIVNKVKNMTSPDVVDKKLSFEPPGKNTSKLNFDLTQLKPQTHEKLEPRDPIRHESLNKGGPLSLNLLERTSDRAPERPFGGPNRSLNKPEFGYPGPDRFGPGATDRFGPGGPDRLMPGGPDRLLPGGPGRSVPGGPDRFGPGGPDRFGPGGPDRFGPGGPDRFGPGGPDRFAPGGPDRFAPGGPDRFGPGGPDRFGIDGPDRFGIEGPDRFADGGPDRFDTDGPDRFDTEGPDRFGDGGPDRFGSGTDRFGPDRFGGSGDSDRFGGPQGPDRFGGPDRNFRGTDRGYNNESNRFGGPDRDFGLDRGRMPGILDKVPLGASRMGGADEGLDRRLGSERGMGGSNRAPAMGVVGTGPDRLAGPGAGQFREGPTPLLDLKNPGNFGNRGGPPPYGGGPPRLGPNDQRNFSRLPPPDFNRPGGNFNRW